MCREVACKIQNVYFLKHSDKTSDRKKIYPLLCLTQVVHSNGKIGLCLIKELLIEVSIVCGLRLVDFQGKLLCIGTISKCLVTSLVPTTVDLLFKLCSFFGTNRSF